MWIPDKSFKSEADEMIQKWYKNNFVIGLQMRAGDSKFINETTDHLKFINCALEIEKEYVSESKRANVTFKWLIATDSNPIRKFLFENYKEKSFISNGPQYFLDHSSVGTLEGFRRAVMDIELLSNCDEIIVTSGSSFGWLAAMKMLKLPYFIRRSSETITKCMRTDLRRLPVNPYGHTSI
jgi:hypothetical protein